MTTRAEAAAKLGISPETIKTRLYKLKWTRERALSETKRTGFRQPGSHPWKRARFGRGASNARR